MFVVGEMSKTFLNKVFYAHLRPEFIWSKYSKQIEIPWNINTIQNLYFIF